MSTDVSEVLAASVIRTMMEAALTSETSVDIELRTRQYIPEDSELDSEWFVDYMSRYHLASVRL
jgi:hypothetical protein